MILLKQLKHYGSKGFLRISSFVDNFLENGRADLTLYVVEKPRLSNYFFKGIKKGQAEDISKKITNLKGRPITPSLENTIKNTVQDFYREKGYLSPELTFTVVNDTCAVNSASIYIRVDKGIKAKISSIEFEGVEALDIGKVRKVYG
jgi:outer membrane protein insertion porin family